MNLRQATRMREKVARAPIAETGSSMHTFRAGVLHLVTGVAVLHIKQRFMGGTNVALRLGSGQARRWVSLRSTPSYVWTRLLLSTRFEQRNPVASMYQASAREPQRGSGPTLSELAPCQLRRGLGASRMAGIIARRSDLGSMFSAAVEALSASVAGSRGIYSAIVAPGWTEGLRQ